MKKTFTMRIPNEIYIDDFSENKTVEYEYDGPETLLIETYGDGGCLSIVEERKENPSPEIIYVEIDANIDTAAAYYLVTRGNLIEIETAESINEYDGSVYVYQSNPRIQDYYQLWYDRGNPDRWTFNLITRGMYTTIELKIKNELDNIKAKLGTVYLPDDIYQVYTAYVTDCEAWLAEKAPLHPWKFVEFPAGNVPKVPLVLIKTINELAAYGAT